MFKSVIRTFLAAAALAIPAAALGVQSAAAGTGARGTSCAKVVSENSCYRWSHSGETTVAVPLSSRRTTGCAQVVSENSCYRWSHRGEPSLAARSPRTTTGCAQVVSENSCYRWAHRADPRTVALPRVATTPASQPFQWSEAGIGAGAAAGAILVALGVVGLFGRRRRVAPSGA
jgi:hypothetical protein